MWCVECVCGVGVYVCGGRVWCVELGACVCVWRVCVSVEGVCGVSICVEFDHGSYVVNYGFILQALCG